MPYTLPALDYDYRALEPHVSARTLERHHSGHHAAYVRGANETLDRLAELRMQPDSAFGSLHRDLAFYVSGHVLHSLFWKGIGPTGGGSPAGELESAIRQSFGSVTTLQCEMSGAASGIQGSGWASLAWDPLSERLLVTALHDHQCDGVQGSLPLLVLDVWEHAYYAQYEDRRSDWIQAFWEIVDWRGVGARFDRMLLPAGISEAPRPPRPIGLSTRAQPT